jgi:membrane protease YdiL (CAAX protease family)
MLAFVVLVFALTVPFYVVGWLTGIELLPRLPLSALAVVCPAAAAFILSYRARGAAGVRSLARTAFDLRLARPAPILAAVLLAPAAGWAAYAVPSALTSEVHVTSIPPQHLAAMAAAFVVAGLLEELGWTAYALGRLRPQASTVRAGLEIGAAWAVWHVVPLVSVGRSVRWIAWWSVGTLALRVVFVWLYRVTGRSTGAVALSHALHNLVWMIIPWYGSQYEPRAEAIATVMAAAAVVALTGAPRGNADSSP